MIYCYFVSGSRDTDKLCDTLSTSNRGTPRGTPRGTLTKNGALSMGNLQDHYTPSHISLWHLVSFFCSLANKGNCICIWLIGCSKRVHISYWFSILFAGDVYDGYYRVQRHCFIV